MVPLDWVSLVKPGVNTLPRVLPPPREKKIPGKSQGGAQPSSLCSILTSQECSSSCSSLCTSCPGFYWRWMQAPEDEFKPFGFLGMDLQSLNHGWSLDRKWEKKPRFKGLNSHELIQGEMCLNPRWVCIWIKKRHFWLLMPAELCSTGLSQQRGAGVPRAVLSALFSLLWCHPGSGGDTGTVPAPGTLEIQPHSGSSVLQINNNN